MASLVPVTARAANPSAPYGEVARFGGFDGTGTKLGEFVYPVGFAVAPAEGNDVYVLDRVQDEVVGSNVKLDYRLQKLSSTGAPLGSVTLPPEEFAEENNAGGFPLISLAVDSAKSRVYALVEEVTESGGERLVPVAQRLVAWSTEPQGGTLVEAPGYSTKDSLTGGALVATLPTVEPSTDLYAPEGLAVDPSNHDVVIEAQQGVRNAHGGPTILQRVITEGADSGQLGEQWVAGSENDVAPGGQQADGLFPISTGATFEGFGIDLFEEYEAISRLADVKASFATPEPALLAKDESGGVNRDEAPTIDGEHTINYNSNHGGQDDNSFVITPEAAGSPVTQLTNGLYAARFAQLGFEALDPQSTVAPWGGQSYFWSQGEESNDEVANEGIRLFTSSGAVVTTVGGQPAAPCNINNAAVSVAAGSKESVFVLTEPNPADGNAGDEVIEFAPGGKGACPQPSGSLTVNGKAGTSFSFPAGTPVTLADTVTRNGEAPYRFDWVLLNPSSEIEDLFNQIEGPEYTWPAPSTSHTFTKKGTYHLAATLYGDYGLTEIGEVVTIKIT
jgi:hypothetical protein